MLNTNELLNTIKNRLIKNKPNTVKSFETCEKQGILITLKPIPCYQYVNFKDPYVNVEILFTLNRGLVIRASYPTGIQNAYTFELPYTVNTSGDMSRFFIVCFNTIDDLAECMEVSCQTLHKLIGCSDAYFRKLYETTLDKLQK